MASTPEAAALTAEHKRHQVLLGAQAELEASEAWMLLDLDNLDATAPAWVGVQSGLLSSRYASSQAIAADYLTEFRLAELGTSAGPLARPELSDAAAMRMLLSNGLYLPKMLIGQGVPGPDAMRIAKSTVAGQVQRWSLAGGRGLLASTAKVDRLAVYRRVTDGNPCAFCAMLAARSIESPNSQSVNFRAHPHCGCTVELRYVDQDRTTDAEAEFVQAYRQAARQARAAGEPVVAPHGRSRRDTVLWRMRRNRPDLFSDGVHAH